MAEECDKVARDLAVTLRDFTNLSLLSDLFDIYERWTLHPSEAREAQIKLKTIIEKKKTDSWSKTENLLKELVRVCR